MDVGLVDIISLACVGLGTGILAGMLGIGGSIIMIPAMAFLFRDRAWADQHLYQAAAMIVNVAVSAPATIRHDRAGTLRRDIVKRVIPPTIIAIVVGVMVSNMLRGPVLELVFAAFLVWAAIDIGIRALRPTPADRPADASAPQVRPTHLTCIGIVMGLASGLLGIGGGIVAVPLLTKFCKLNIREGIAVSAATMMFTAGIGAILKMATLAGHGRSWKEAVVLALLLVPTALLGGYIGGGLTQTVPVRGLRGVLAVAILGAAAKMAGVW